MTVTLYRMLAFTMMPLAAVGVGVSQETGGPLTIEDGERLESKLAQIMRYDAVGGAPSQTVVLLEREVNAYLQFQAVPQLPPSVTAPYVSIDVAGALSGQATVDLGVVGQSRQRGLLDPLRYLRGTVVVAATGVLHTTNGVGQLEIVSVRVGDLVVPATVLYELVRYYSRSEAQPEGFDLAEPFDLPYRIREVLAEVDQAVVVQ